MTPDTPEAGTPATRATPEVNTQAGIPLTSPESDEGLVASGDRRDEVHYEADPDQLVKVRSLTKPEGPIPPEGDSEPAVDASADGPIEDVLVAPATPSVWDARPPPEEPDGPGHSATP